jgi:ribulose-5-phosphate 4-epimerase/fuculose-1-phosphate aldolase
MDAVRQDEINKQDLVHANHILAHNGILDAFGHVSVRSAVNPGRYFMSRSSAPSLVAPEDIMEFDLEGNPIDLQGRKIYAERFIHGEIFKARPDVNAVVHSHSPSVIPYSVTDTALQPVCHMASFLQKAVPVFEIRDVEGENNSLLIVKGPTAAALAKVLGDSTVVLMRGHGNAVVAGNLRLAVFRAIYTELNAKIQSESLRLGKVNYLTLQEAKNFQGAFEGSDANLQRPWDLWVREVAAQR